jgi:hypothetical protein
VPLFALGKIGKFLDDASPAITALATLAIAAFTFTLARFTNQQARLTKEIADAALLSAKAAIGVELPRVLIREMEFMNPSDAASLQAQLQFARGVVVVKNYGRTPAFLRQRSIDAAIAQVLPKTPNYRSAHDLDAGTVIEGGATYTLPVASAGILNNEEIADLISGKIRFWVWGHIHYRDFMDDSHGIRFCGQLYIPPDNPLSTGGGPRFIQGGPNGYEANW